MPAALAGAAALEVLDLTGNPQLELCRPDVDAVLLRMPRLGLLLLGKWPGCTAAMDWRTGGPGQVVRVAWLSSLLGEYTFCPRSTDLSLEECLA